jgi:hypothetical protein
MCAVSEPSKSGAKGSMGIFIASRAQTFAIRLSSSSTCFCSSDPVRPLASRMSTVPSLKTARDARFLVRSTE